MTRFVPEQLPVALSAPIALRDSAVVAVVAAAIGYLRRRFPRSRVIFRMAFMYLVTLFCITLFMTWAYNYYSLQQLAGVSWSTATGYGSGRR